DEERRQGEEGVVGERRCLVEGVVLIPLREGRLHEKPKLSEEAGASWRSTFAREPWAGRPNRHVSRADILSFGDGRSRLRHEPDPGRKTCGIVLLMRVAGSARSHRAARRGR